MRNPVAIARDYLFKPNSQKSEISPPILRETAWTDHSVFYKLSGGFSTYNPDILVQKKGAKIYRNMLTDPQVKAAYNLLVDIIVSREYAFEKQNDDPINDEIIDFFNYNINISLNSSWIAALRAIQLSKAQGYSVSEKNYRTGTWRNKERWLLRSIKSKPYETFEFDIDEFGNINRLLQDQETRQVKLDPKKFVVMVNMPELDPVFGESDLKAAYRAYWEKDNILKFRNIWLERIAGGFIVGSPGENAAALQGQDKIDFQNTMKNVSKATSIIAPAGWEIDIKTATDTDAFEKAVVHSDRQIAKALLMPNLIGLSEEGKFGSRALGDTQFDIFMFIIEEQGEYLADNLNEQVFKELALWNYDYEDFPQFKFKKHTAEQRRKIAAAWTDAVDKGVVINTVEDETKTRDLLLYPQRNEDDEPLNAKPDPVDDEPGDEMPDDEPDNEPGEPEPNPLDVLNEPAPLDLLKETLEKIETMSGEVEKLKVLAENFPPIDVEKTFSERINFDRLEKDLDKVESKFVADMAAGVDKMFSDVKREFKAIHENLPGDKNAVNFDAVIDEINAGAISSESKSIFKKAIQSNLSVSYDLGRGIAKGAIKNAAAKAPARTRDRISTVVEMSRRYISKADDWSIKNFLEGIALDTAEKYFESKAFQITGDISQDILKQAREIFVNGIRDELSIVDIVAQLSDVLPTLVGKKDPITGKPDKQERSRLETIARTNMISVFTQSQLAVYSDPDLGDFVQGLEYSAVMDSRTTDVCENLNGRKYRFNDPVWRSVAPPNHFNCRSSLIPITAMDEWNPSSKEGFKTKSDKGPGNMPAPGFGERSLENTLKKQGAPPPPAEKKGEIGTPEQKGEPAKPKKS